MSADFNLVAALQLQGPVGLGSVRQQIQAGLRGLTANVDINVSQASIANTSSLNNRLTEVNSSLRSIAALTREAASGINNLNSSLTAGRSPASSFTNSFKQVGDVASRSRKELNAAASDIQNFGYQAGLSGRRLAAFVVGATGISLLVNSIRNGLAEGVRFQAELVRIGQVSGDTSSQIGKIQTRVTSLATNLGVASKELVTSATTLRQAGRVVAEVNRDLEAVALADLAPNFKGQKQVVEGLIAVFAQFKRAAKDPVEVLGSLNAVAGAFATEASDLISVIQRAGGAFASSGGQLNELLALFTSVRATTRESAESISTSLRTIFSRLQSNSTVEALKELSINLRFTREEAERSGDLGLENQFVGAYEAVRRLSEGLAGLRSTDPRYAQIVDEIGGKRNVSKIIPLIQEQALAQNAYNVAQAGGVSLAISAEKAQESLVVQLKRVSEQYQALFNSLTTDNQFKSMAKFALEAASSVAKLVDALRPLIPLVAGIGIAKLVSTGITQAAPFAAGLLRGGRKFATGGGVPGTGIGDTVPAMLEPGEFIFTKRAVQNAGGISQMRMLHDSLKNRGQIEVQRFANGGPVGYASGGEVHPAINFRAMDIYQEIEAAAKKLGVVIDGSTQALVEFSESGPVFKGLVESVKKVQQTIENVVSPSSAKGGLQPNLNSLSKEQRDALVTENAGIVPKVVGQLKRKGVVRDEGMEAESLAGELLITAASKFDPGQDKSFPAYASTIIRNGIAAEQQYKKNAKFNAANRLAGPEGQTIDVGVGTEAGVLDEVIAKEVTAQAKETLPELVKRAVELKSKPLSSLNETERAARRAINEIARKNPEIGDVIAAELVAQKKPRGRPKTNIAQPAEQTEVPLSGSLPTVEQPYSTTVYSGNQTPESLEKIAQKLTGSDPLTRARQEKQEKQEKAKKAKEDKKEKPGVNLGQLLGIPGSASYGSGSADPNSFNRVVNNLPPSRGGGIFGIGPDGSAGGRPSRDDVYDVVREVLAKPQTNLDYLNHTVAPETYGLASTQQEAARIAATQRTSGRSSGVGTYQTSTEAIARQAVEQTLISVARGNSSALRQGNRALSRGLSEEQAANAIRGSLSQQSDLLSERQARKEYGDYGYERGSDGLYRQTGYYQTLAIERRNRRPNANFDPTLLAAQDAELRRVEQERERARIVSLRNAVTSNGSITGGAEASNFNQLQRITNRRNLSPEAQARLAELIGSQRPDALAGRQRDIANLPTASNAVEQAAMLRAVIYQNPNSPTYGPPRPTPVYGPPKPTLAQRIGSRVQGFFDRFGVQTPSDPSERLQRGFLYTAAAGTAVGAATYGLSRFGGDAEASVAGNRTGAYRASKGAQGFLTGAFAGATSGALIGGAVGSVVPGAGNIAGASLGAIGGAVFGVVGALAGLTGSLNEASSDIRQVRINNALTSFGDKLLTLTKAGGTGDATSQFEARSNLSTYLASVNEKNRADATTLLGGFSETAFADLKSRSFRQDLGSQLPQIVETLGKQAESLGKNNPTANSDTILKNLSEGGNGLNKELLRIVAGIRGISVDKALEDFKKVIEASASSARLQEQRLIRRGSEERAVNSFDRLAVSVAAAADSLREFQIRSQVLSDLFTGIVGASKLSGNTEALSQLGRLDRTALQPITLAGSLGGENGRSLIGAGNAIDAVARVLPNVLANVAAKPPTEGQDFITSTRTGILESLNVRPNQVTPELNSVLSSVIRQLEDASKNGTADIVNELEVDPNKFVEKIVNQAGEAVIRATTDIVKNFENVSNEFVSGLVDLTRRVQTIREGLSELDSLRLNSSRTNAEFAAQRFGGRPTDFLSLQQLEAPFNLRQQRLTGLNAGAASDPQTLATLLAKANRDVVGAEENQRAAFNNPGVNGQNFRAAAESLILLKDKAANYRQALENLTKVTERAAGPFEKLARLQQEREGRLGFAEKFFSSDVEGRNRISRGLSLANAANNNGSLDGFQAGDQQLIIETLRSLGPSTLSGFNGGPQADVLLRRLLENSGGGFGRLNGGQQAEEKFLQGRIQGVNADAEAAKGALNDNLGNLNEALFKGLRDLQVDFFTRLEQFLTRDKLAAANNGIATLSVKQGKLNEINTERQSLAQFGITSPEQVKALAASRDVLEALQPATKAVADSKILGQKLIGSVKSDFAGFDDKKLGGFVNASGTDSSSLNLAGKDFVSTYLQSFTSLTEKQKASISDRTENIIARGEIPGIGRINRGTAKRDISQAIGGAISEEFVNGNAPLGTTIGNANQGVLRARTAVQGLGIQGVNSKALTDSLSANPQTILKSLDKLTEFINQNPGASFRILDAEINETALSLKNLRTTIDTIGLSKPELRAAGGGIFQPSGTDTVPAMLTPNEFVVNAKSAMANAGLLTRINNAKGPVRLAAGGFAIPPLRDGSGRTEDATLYGGRGPYEFNHRFYKTEKEAIEAQDYFKKKLAEGPRGPLQQSPERGLNASLTEQEKLLLAKARERFGSHPVKPFGDGIDASILGKKYAANQRKKEAEEQVLIAKRAEELRAGQAALPSYVPGQQLRTPASIAEDIANSQPLSPGFAEEPSNLIAKKQAAFEKERQARLTRAKNQETSLDTLDRLIEADRKNGVKPSRSEPIENFDVGARARNVTAAQAAAIRDARYAKAKAKSKSTSGGVADIANAAQQASFNNLQQRQILANSEDPGAAFGRGRAGYQTQYRFGIDSLERKQQALDTFLRNNPDVQQYYGSQVSGQNLPFASSVNSRFRRRFATGGIVGGADGTDTIPAWLTSGEYVLNQGATSRIGKQNLDKMNGYARGGIVGNYADGGAISSPSSANTLLPENAVQAISAFGSSANILVASITNFSQSSNSLVQSFNQFSGNATALTDALNRMPRTITGQFSHQVNVNHNGAEMLAQLTPSIQKMVVQNVNETLSKVFKTQLPDANLSVE